MVLFTFQTTRAWYVTSHWQTTPGLRLMMPSTQKSQACSQTTDNRNISWQALGQWLDYKIICTTRNWYLILMKWSGFISLPNHATIHITFAQKDLQFSQSFLCSIVWSQYDVKKWRWFGFAGEINGSKLSQYDGWCCQGGSCSVSCQVSQSIHTGICSRNWSKRVQ